MLTCLRAIQRDMALACRETTAKLIEQLFPSAASEAIEAPAPNQVRLPGSSAILMSDHQSAPFFFLHSCTRVSFTFVHHKSTHWLGQQSLLENKLTKLLRVAPV